MNRHHLTIALLSLTCLTVQAGPREDLLAGYAREAGLAGPAALSASRGEALHQRQAGGGKADTPSCTTCHQSDIRQPGRTPSGKRIEPMALSASPERYTDPAKLEKWFKRNCNEVLGRACTAQEKGDWLTYVQSR
ncbi:DUF1924 domain-containing protein [Azovibrio restrictus]|uniref:DUF1924 domain-containing protein n=1 Tax=Azovibrio restrictus TaxID=146938 RepID=UPI00041EE986|nr:DUF1924 domain-containing protein [Azovibrio restrictus]